jgi:hypothetical protein
MKNKLNKFITASLITTLLVLGFASAQTSDPVAEISSPSSPAISVWDGECKAYTFWKNMTSDEFMPTVIIFSLIVIIFLAFWIWMLVHAASSDIIDKPIWLLVIWFMNIVGAVIYFFVVKRRYDAEIKECGCESCACDENEDTCACDVDQNKCPCGKNETCQCAKDTEIKEVKE